MSFVKSNGITTDEMSIVDVLTKLIFDAESQLDETELLIVSLLGQIDASLVNVSRRDVSEYLRSMGVDEMIKVVGRIKFFIDRQQELIAARKTPPSRRLQH